MQFAFNNSRNYLTNRTEFRKRCSIFKTNLENAKLLNQQHKFPVYGITKFSDISPDEFQAIYLSSYKVQPNMRKDSSLHFSSMRHSHINIPDLPQTVDWREKKVLTSIKDQKSCGACWAFSVVETIESMYAIKYNRTPPVLSVQELIDCDDTCKGCQGGRVCLAVEWVQMHGVVAEKYYPLTDQTDKCRNISATMPRITLQNFICSSYTDREMELLSLLTQGPVAVAIDATTWHNYIGGIIQFHCSENVNHAVQIVGYDLTGDVPFYIVRNSWGENFGDKGFLYIKIGGNLCGLTTEVSHMNVN